MATKIKHIAIACDDNEKVAVFYKEVFGMAEVARYADKHDPNVFHISVSDGNICLALIPSIVGNTPGLNHIGFACDDVEETMQKALNHGAKLRGDLPRGDNPEAVIVDPTEARIDLATYTTWSQATPEQLEEVARIG